MESETQAMLAVSDAVTDPCTQAPLLTVVNDCRYFIYTINQERFGMRIDFAKSDSNVIKMNQLRSKFHVPYL